MTNFVNLHTARKISRIVVHCSATPPVMMGVDAATIRHWHQKRGWSDIGYHFVITRDGTLEAGRPLDRTGAHVAGYNTGSIGVCLVGGVDDLNKPEMNYTAAQVRTLVELLDELEMIYEPEDILGHRDFSGVAKACPCFDVRHFRKTGTLVA